MKRTASAIFSRILLTVAVSSVALAFLSAVPGAVATGYYRYGTHSLSLGVLNDHIFADNRKTETRAEPKTLRGWLTDEACARGRATGGKYTGGNPDCARRCVAEGKNIVLALPDEKKLLVVANREIARSNVGNYVEVTGDVDGETVRISSLTMLQEGVASCAAPGKKN